MVEIREANEICYLGFPGGSMINLPWENFMDRGAWWVVVHRVAKRLYREMTEVTEYSGICYTKGPPNL